MILMGPLPGPKYEEKETMRTQDSTPAGRRPSQARDRSADRRPAGRRPSQARDRSADRRPEGRSFARGTIGEEVKSLLGHPGLSYSDVAAVVHNRHPDASTTAKSVASMAKAFRAKGVPVPERESGLGRPRLH